MVTEIFINTLVIGSFILLVLLVIDDYKTNKKNKKNWKDFENKYKQNLEKRIENYLSNHDMTLNHMRLEAESPDGYVHNDMGIVEIAPVPCGWMLENKILVKNQKIKIKGAMCIIICADQGFYIEIHENDAVVSELLQQLSYSYNWPLETFTLVARDKNGGNYLFRYVGKIETPKVKITYNF